MLHQFGVSLNPFHGLGFYFLGEGKKLKKPLFLGALILVLEVFLLPLFQAEAKAEQKKEASYGASFSSEGTLWRLDAENVPGLPRNYRTCDDAYRAIPPRYAKEASSRIPSRKGLSELHISGSSQYSEKGLDAVLAVLRKRTQGPIILVDLRQESHGFLNGMPVSWYGKRNWANRGKGHFAVLFDEARRIHALWGKDVTFVRLKTDKRPLSTVTVKAVQVLTEAELAAQKGVMYVRFTATDHLWPDAGEIERFRRFAANLPKDAWLHFHCVAGEGRTTAFMTMYDMLKNPDVPYEDIVLRQLRIGGVYTPFLGKGLSTWKKPYYREKKIGLEDFYQRLQDNQKISS